MVALIQMVEVIGIALAFVFGLVIAGFLFGLGFWLARFYGFDQMSEVD